MSNKRNKTKARQQAKQRSLERKRKRKKKQEQKRKKGGRNRQELQVENIVSQLGQQQKPTFSRDAFQASQPAKNTTSGTVRSAVLNTEPRKVGFSKGAWGPPKDEHTETG